MNRQTSAGPTGFGWVRSVLTFRHRNPVARFVSALVAFAMATLLVVGSGAAYAGDTAPTDPATTSSTDPAADVPTDPAATSSTDPAATTDATSADPGTTADATTPADTSPTPTAAPKKAVAKTTTTTMSALSIVPQQVLAYPLSDTGGFEIDGDTIDGNNGGADFTNADLVAESYRDAQGYQGTNKLANDPSGWAGAQVATEKMDMVKLWVRTILSGPRSAFGIQRDAANGTTAYYFEYNHLPNLAGDVAKPDRSPNDVMFGFTQSGNNAGNKLSFDEAYVYALVSSSTWNSAGTTCTQVLGSSPAGGWCTLDTDNGVFYSATSDGSGNGAANTYPEGIFAEGIVDFSKLNFPQGTCLGALGHLNVRSQSSLEWTSAMQDFAVADVNVPSTCGSLTVLKKGLTGDTLVPGAIYSIVDDPRPGKTGTYKVFDGTQAQLDALNLSSDPAPSGTVADGSANGKIEVDNAEPGTYTVTELRAPAGYLLPADRDQVVTVGAIGSADPRNPEITFRDPIPWSPLTAKKSAQGDYDTTYTWTISKGVRYGSDAFGASASKDSANSSESFDWKVSIGEGTRTESNHAVTGAITISNPNGSAVVATVSETLTGCTIYDPADTTPPLTALSDASADPGFQVSVPANGSGSGTAYQYTCVQADKSATSNTVTVTVDRATYPRNQADVDAGAGTYTAAVTPGLDNTLSPSITWTEHNPDGTKVIQVTDVLQGTSTTHSGSGAPWTHTWGDHADPTWNAGTSKYEHVYASSVTATPGSCASVTNLATITDTGQTATATASHCVGANLTVSKNKTVHLTRTYLWKIDKTRTSAADITSGQSASYSVTVSRGDGDGYADSGWSMDGFITVSNPNDWAVTLTGVTDQYDGDNDVTNSCQVTASRANDNAALDASINYAVPHNGSYQYKYVCDFGSKPDYDGINTATATWSAATAHTSSGTASGTASVATSDWSLAATPVNKVITVTDDQYTGGSGVGGHTLGTVDWDEAPQTFTYSITWTAQAGTCETKPNTATIVETDQSDSASVEVCNPVDLTVSKTADGSYTRTYLWDLDKKIVGPSRSAEDSYDHTFDYLVTLKENGVQDSTWKVRGTITVTNNNTDGDIPDYTASVTDAMTGVGGSPSCQWDDGKGEPEAQWPDMPASVTLASGAHADIDYVCSFLSQPAYSGGTNKATATWTGGSASSSDVPVSFAETNSVDKTVHVVDDKTTGTFVELPNSPVTYGSHGSNDAWVAADSLYEFPYSVPLSYDPAVGGDCQDFPNTARVLGDGAVVLDHAEAQASICPLAGTWEVSKDVAEPHAVKPGTTLHYTLTAHKTSVVDAQGVVVHDDLSDIVDHITGDPAFSSPDASYDASTHVLTWDVGTLSGTETLDFSVVVKSDAYGVDLPNLITSPGSDNCDPQLEGFPADECDTDNVTPHYTLEKSSDAGAQVMPPYLGDPGTLITYTLTVHNDSDAPINATTMPGEQVTDDLSNVLDNASWVGNITPDGQAMFDGDHTLTWTLPEIAANGQAGDTVTLTYQVRVAGDQWDETLTNVAHEGPGGDCLAPEVGALVVVVNPNCTTTTVTPPYALIQALKVDADTGAHLVGAEFSLYQGTEQTEANLLGTATSGDDGTALFGVKLQPGVFTVVETAAPDGYDLPAGGGAVHQVTITADDLDNGATPVQSTFADPPQGALAIAKAHQERSGSAWVAGDGQVAFNDEIKYVMTVTATGPKVFHDVTVTDYVPGWNPADTTTAPAGTKAVLEPATITCGGGVTCTSSYDAATGLITWHLTGAGDDTGDVQGDVGTVEFVVRMPNIPATSPIQTPGTSFAAVLWNQATLLWSVAGDETPDTHSQLSNAVTDAASATLPPEVKPPQVSPPGALPNTGGPDRWLLMAGLVLLLGGGTIVAGGRPRRRRI